MMTGQLLGGATPLVAAEYQMAILWLICATTSISTYVGECLLHPRIRREVLPTHSPGHQTLYFLFYNTSIINPNMFLIFLGASLAMTHAAFDKDHRLTTDRITMRVEGKVTIEVALLLSLKGMLQGIFAAFLAAVKASPIGARGIVSGTGITVSGKSRPKVDSSDRESVSVSRHGLMADEEKGGGRDGYIEMEMELYREGSSTDDDVTVILSPHSLVADVSRSKSPFTVLPCADGKVTYSFLSNTPTAHTDLERPQSLGPIFKADGINVLSGEENLFCSDGLTMVLKRCTESSSTALHSGYRIVLIVPSSLTSFLLFLFVFTCTLIGCTNLL
jgi:Uncharacterised protein family (UPF0014)